MVRYVTADLHLGNRNIHREQRPAVSGRRPQERRAPRTEPHRGPHGSSARTSCDRRARHGRCERAAPKIVARVVVAIPACRQSVAKRMGKWMGNCPIQHVRGVRRDTQPSSRCDLAGAELARGIAQKSGRDRQSGIGQRSRSTSCKMMIDRPTRPLLGRAVASATRPGARLEDR
jgi:hypothetical protein